MKYYSKLILTSTLVLAFALLFQINDANAQDQNVVEVVNSDSENTVFAELLNETDMPEILNQKGPFTVLVPTDEALEALDTDVEELKQNPKQLQNVVSGHLYQGKMPAEKVEAALGVEIVDGDNSASNGVVHIVDEVVKRN